MPRKPAHKGDRLVKQDMNLLLVTPWFIGMQKDESGHFHSIATRHGEGEVRTGETPPEMLDQVILLYLMYKSSRNGWETDFTVTPHEVLTACGLSTKNSWYMERLKNSLWRWKNIAIRFKGSFYDGGKHVDMFFGIMEQARYKEKNGRYTIRIRLNPAWIEVLKESNYYRPLSFEFFKALKVPVACRLYEILLRSSSPFKIGILKLGRWMDITPQMTKTGKRVLIESHVLRFVDKGIAEINRVAGDEDYIRQQKIDYSKIFTVTYEIQESTGEYDDDDEFPNTSGQRNIVFTKSKVTKPKIALPKVNTEKMADDFLLDAYGGEYTLFQDKLTRGEKLELYTQLRAMPKDDDDEIINKPPLEYWIEALQEQQETSGEKVAK